MSKCQRLAVAAIACFVVAGVSVLARIAAVHLCGGEFIYPIDDTYIHIAMAKALAVHGTWGVEAGKMAFCSSSPLWTLVLGGLYAVAGVREALPWYLALLFNLGAVVLVERTVAAFTDDWRVRLGGALAVAFAAPFVCTTALGMEHAMHAFFMLATIAAGARLCRTRSAGAAALCCVLAACATASRYESLFFLLPFSLGCCCLEAYALWKDGKRPIPRAGMSVGLAAAFPVLAYGMVALLNGGHFLPNSLLLKGNFSGPSELLSQAMRIFGTVPEGYGLLYLLAFVVGIVAVSVGATAYWRIVAAALVIAIFGQVLFARVGQLLRYEAYLYAMGTFVLSALVASAGGFGKVPRAYLPIGAVLVVAVAFSQKAVSSFSGAIHCSADIRRQQVVMTRIMAALPDEDRGCVALNDLGYMALYGGFPFVDLWGLGSQDAAELRMRHPSYMEPDYCEILAKEHGIRYFVVFENWYPRSLMPEGTVDVAYLTLKDNVVCGGDTVVFRATSAKAAEKLREHLLKYRDRMPSRVTLRVL